MRYQFIIAVAVLGIGLSSCSSLQPHEKAADAHATQAGLVSVKKSNFDVSYVFPNANLGQYKKILLSDIDFSNVKITRSVRTIMDDTPWELNDADKDYFQQKYRDAANSYLFKSGKFLAASEPAADTLVLKMKIIDIAPLGSKDDSKGRPDRVDVYTQGFGRMTAVFELYDSTGNKLLAMSSDEQELGYLWEKNNRVQTNMRIRLALEVWMRKLNDEMLLWSKS